MMKTAIQNAHMKNLSVIRPYSDQIDDIKSALDSLVDLVFEEGHDIRMGDICFASILPNGGNLSEKSKSAYTWKIRDQFDSSKRISKCWNDISVEYARGILREIFQEIKIEYESTCESKAYFNMVMESPNFEEMSTDQIIKLKRGWKWSILSMIINKHPKVELGYGISVDIEMYPE